MHINWFSMAKVLKLSELTLPMNILFSCSQRNCLVIYSGQYATLKK